MKAHLVSAYHWVELSSGNKAGRIFCQKIDYVSEEEDEEEEEEEKSTERGVVWKEKLTLVQKNLWNGNGIMGYFLETSKNSK